MPACSFCNRTIEPGTGTAIVQRTGKLIWFCSSKCEKCARLGRSPRTTAWVRKTR